jgi:hypothetical protein
LVINLPVAGVSPYDHELRFDPYRAAAGELDRVEEWKARSAEIRRNPSS